MKRLHRAGLIGLLLGGLATGSVQAQERMVSLLPPVGRGSQASGAAAPSGAPTPPSAEPLLIAPYDPAQGGIVQPRGANLPKGSSFGDPYESGDPAVAFEFALPEFECPDVGSKLASVFCEGPFNPADVSDPTWLRIEAAMWWFRDMKLPALVTTSDLVDLGVLGQPTTRVVFGDREQWLPMKPGAKLTVGSWFDPTEALGFELSYLFLVNRTLFYNNFNFGTDTLTARPFFNVVNGQQDSAIIGTPAIPEYDAPRQRGQIIVAIPGRLNSLEVNGVSNYCRGANGRIDWIFGFRYVGLFEAINIYDRIRIPRNQPEMGGYESQVDDAFSAKNYAYTGQIGLRTENRWGKLALNLEGKLGLGWAHHAAYLQGVTGIDQNRRYDAFTTGGLLVQKTNAGNYNGDSFIAIPELGFRLTYEVADHVFLTGGYNFLFLSSVWRPGDFIDLRLNPNLIPPQSGSPAPGFPIFEEKTTSFWAHGVLLGLEVRY